MAEVFSFLQAWAWLVFVAASLVFLAGAVTFAWWLRQTRMRPYAWWLVVAGLLFCAGFVLGGMQAGDRPIVERTVLIPWIRLTWLAGSLCGTLFLVVFWGRRIKVLR